VQLVGRAWMTGRAWRRQEERHAWHCLAIARKADHPDEQVGTSLRDCVFVEDRTALNGCADQVEVPIPRKHPKKTHPDKPKNRRPKKKTQNPPPPQPMSPTSFLVAWCAIGEPEGYCVPLCCQRSATSPKISGWLTRWRKRDAPRRQV